VTLHWRPGYVLILLVLVPVILVDVFPLIVMVSTSLKTQQEVYLQPPTFIPRAPTLQNYIDIWNVAPLASYFQNSIILGTGEMVLALALAIPAGYALARFRFHGRRAYLLFLMVIQIFPPVVIILALYRLVATLGLTDNLGTLIVLDTVFSLSFDIWLLTSYFASVPVEIEEAAMMDGNSRLGAMLRMSVPLAAPGIVAVAIFSFIDGWNEFLFALTFIRSSDKYPLTLGLFKYVSRYQVEWHQLLASGLLATIVVVVLFMFVQRQLTRGLIAGAER
jgi:multiple sugar transport system permease protein